MRAYLLLLTVCFVHTGFAQQGRSVTDLKTENVFLITLDGLRWQELFTGSDALLVENEKYVGNPAALTNQFHKGDANARRKTLMPFFWSELLQKGQIYGNRALGCDVNLTNNEWFSYPGYNEILTGRADVNITSNDKIPNPNTTVLEFVNRQAGFEGRVAAFGSWDVFPYIVNEERSGVPVNAGFEAAKGEDLTPREQFLNDLQEEIPSPWGTVRLDAFTHHYALEYLKKKHPKLLYIAYGETDDFAHDGDYEAYLKSAHQTDQFIADLWAFTQEDPVYKGTTTFIITTDHGRGTEPLDTWRGHGTDIKGADQIWMAVLGPDSPALGEVKDCKLFQNQVASTTAAFLGFDWVSVQEAGATIRSAFK
ncbi:MAG: alkaline phosphatase family protein [Rhodothermales bacterium]